MTHMMLCQHCERRVATNSTHYDDPLVAEDLAEMYDAYPIDGPFRLENVGESMETIDGSEATVGVRVDRCSECDAVLRVWTYLKPS